MLYWVLLGPVIGFAVAHRRGWALFAGALGGALLGPLALLLFFVSGVTRGDQQRKCQHCAAWVKAAVKVYKHCWRALAELNEPVRGPAGWVGALLVTAVLVLAGGAAMAASPPEQANTSNSADILDSVAATCDWVMGLLAVVGTLVGAWLGANATLRSQRLALEHEERSRFHAKRVESYSAYLSAANRIMSFFQATATWNPIVATELQRELETARLLVTKPVFPRLARVHEILTSVCVGRAKDREAIQVAFNEAIAELVIAMRCELGVQDELPDAGRQTPGSGGYTAS